ncbi:hypothetical protein BE04_06765 [Sorangium cellulosum]|uniref:Uncharacterized protein n=1 Tax=Sorangium cellulosum TaxID=56 RepID=A0A150PJR7_SORCE|nr:hypothetical protein BE04_06765 [Sorangium cellulosum]
MNPRKDRAMTIEETQRLIQGIFDAIFNSVTQAEPGGKPVMPSSSTVLSMRKPGMAIRSADFSNPWTPGNISGSKNAAINIARLVDDAPEMSTFYDENGNTITQIYKQILDGVSIPAQPPNPAIEKQLSDAEAVLYRTVEVTDPDTGQKTSKRVETQLYRDYLDKLEAYNKARASYTAAFLEAQKTEQGRNTWPLIASTRQLPVRLAYDRWRAAGADKIEQAQAIKNTSSQNALQKAWDGAKKLFEGYGVQLEDSGSGMSVPIQRCTLLPSDWHSESSTGWTDLSVSSSSAATSSSSEYRSYGGSAGFSLGLFSIGGSGGHSSSSRHASAETKNMTISFSYTLVAIRRPWMTFNLLGTKGWNLGNLYGKGAISNGTKVGQEHSAMPLLPTSFVVVKNVVISANWAKADWELIKSQTNAGGGFGIGPFSISGRYAHSRSNETFKSDADGGKITVPGVQIIGFISQIVPFCPPA